MTLYGWDLSHYDGHITATVAARAKAEGIAFATHKVGEGTGGDDPEDATALAAFRDAGVEFLGGYHVVRSGAISPQVDALLALADRDEPWWRTYPGWFWQVDLERWSYDQVPASTGIAFGQLLQARTGRLVVMYASHGQYAQQLTTWDGPLWNADYTSRPAGGFAAMYPGDRWMPTHGSGTASWQGGWAPYSGKTPTFLQYTSSAIIAGLTTCDANAYRGTVDELRALINPSGGSMGTAAENAVIATRDGMLEVDGKVNCPPVWETNRQKREAAADATAARIESKIDQIIASLAGGTLSDTDVQRIAVAVADENARRQQA